MNATRERSVRSKRRGGFVIVFSAIAATLSLLFTIGSGLALQGFPSNRPEAPMNNFLELVGR